MTTLNQGRRPANRRGAPSSDNTRGNHLREARSAVWGMDVSDSVNNGSPPSPPRISRPDGRGGHNGFDHRLAFVDHDVPIRGHVVEDLLGAGGPADGQPINLGLLPKAE